MDSLINSGFIAIFFALLVGSISYVANNFRATPLEKKLMTSFEKIKIRSSKAFILSFVSVVIVSLILIFDEEIDGTSVPMFVLLLIIIMLFFFVMFFAHIVITEYFKSRFTKKKLDYFITLTNEKGIDTEWKVIRMTGSNYLLIKHKDSEEYRLLKDYDNLSIKAVEVEEIKAN